jgi:2-(3-amino-3-carboxypropyl)histidine synthase
MEDDRAATNLGPSAEDGMNEEPTVVPRQPKRRFVGRKAAEKVAGNPNENIEDSSAIQGVRHPRSERCTL